jgi:hypothetical protein
MGEFKIKRIYDAPSDDDGYRFSNDLLKFGYRNALAVMVVHGILNRELVKILKTCGWQSFEKRKDGYVFISELPGIFIKLLDVSIY